MELFRCNYVLIGNFNPAIYTEQFFSSYFDMEMKSEIEEKEFSGMVAKLRSETEPQLSFYSDLNRMEFQRIGLQEAQANELNLVRDLASVIEILVGKLPFTPVRVAGFNFNYRLDTENVSVLAEKLDKYFQDAEVSKYQKRKTELINHDESELCAVDFTYVAMQDDIRRKFVLEKERGKCRFDANFEFRVKAVHDSILKFVVMSRHLVDKELLMLKQQLEEH